ncbi:hypothetical protein INT08_04840 [Prosthecochloris sp. N3]|uniref:Cell division protein FtsL n=1 Tax=Prosthecochloris ethylica TaxID=2743976 RepID=A0ABR9XRT3_9CHLB|nr:hypothetical protein [Prosthecochloris ethylica]MBF0586094.1 hypothetical protein [Prosthecochloris ethylica]MBF0636506.1 hypothetical protein [Prosthecochloris ethylica]NUK47138.1 hypothetical protein [Prosthecochloris ethylica]
MSEHVQSFQPARRVAAVAKAAVSRARSSAPFDIERLRQGEAVHRKSVEAPPAAAAAPGSGAKRFGSLLRLRTFVFLVGATVLLVLYINNLLTINALSAENEVLKEKISISRSINAALELKLQEQRTFQRISEEAAKLGLAASPVAAIEIRE